MSELDRKEWLEKQHRSIQISLARKGKLGKFLPTDLWEELRIELQNEYRRATGEPTATLIVAEAGQEASDARVAALEKRVAFLIREVAAHFSRSCMLAVRAEDAESALAALRAQQEERT